MELFYGLIMFIHLVAAMFWVGGIFLVYRVFRPVVLQLEPPQRLTLFLGVFNKFFPWVWLFIVALLVTGYIGMEVAFGGLDSAPWYLVAMEVVGWVMIVLFAWLYFVYFKRFKQQLELMDYAAAGRILHVKMRPIIVTNLFLGVVEAFIGTVGSFL